MSFQTVPTVVTGDTWTASNHNTYIKDNFAETAPAKVTAKGDIVYASAPNTLTRLAIGSPGYILTSTSDNIPAWSVSYEASAIVRNSSTQSYGPAVSADILMDTDLYVSPASMHSTTTDTEKIYAPVNGLYLCVLNCSFGSGGTAGAECWAGIITDAAVAMVSVQSGNLFAGSSRYFSASGTVSLTAGQYVAAHAYNGGGVAVNLSVFNFSVQLVRAL